VNTFYLIARIVSLFGKDGHIKIKSFSDISDRFFNINYVFVDFWGEKKKFFIEDVKQLNDAFALKFKYFGDERSSQLLIGKDVYVDKSDSSKLQENEFFVHDLIGSRVIRDNEEIGVIKDFTSLPANDVLVIENKKNKEILLPFVLEFIEYFDPEKKMLVLKKDAGYYDED